ncbi:alanine:cation symporter family protein, partial [bacterium]|nr:alanine:cation symporter family protein [bacterium]
TGSAPIAYATVKTKEPISQGFVSLLEPFLTACLCVLSALTIVITGSYKEYNEGVSGIQLTSSAFESVISWSPYVLAVVIILFALSTIISWAYYGQKGWTYLFGEGKKRIIFYQLLFCGVIIAGASINLKSIVDFTDAGMLAMSVPNLIALYILMKDVKFDLEVYCKEYNVCPKFITRKSR